ncbi:MAG TPA: nickel insertion protein, partial [Deinococcales bacterium]|nr:nickel insertion protein [Deinococcales bacterium]
MKILYIECNMGVAGDMLMAALYELLSDEQKRQCVEKMNGLGLPGVKVAPCRKTTCGIAGTHMEVTVHGEEEREPDAAHGHPQDFLHDHECGHQHGHEHEHGHHHASPGRIAALIDGLPLPERVREHARRVYDLIAEAEAKAHGCPAGDVHFHEVGALDAVADVAGVCYALEMLRPERILASPVHVGSGTVRCAHGVMPVPA